MASTTDVEFGLKALVEQAKQVKSLPETLKIDVLVLIKEQDEKIKARFPLPVSKPPLPRQWCGIPVLVANSKDEYRGMIALMRNEGKRVGLLSSEVLDG